MQYFERRFRPVMQNRGTGDGQLTDAPGAGQVAEIDDAIGANPAGGIAWSDHVVVGGIAVNGLQRQSRFQRLKAECGFFAGFRHFPAAFGAAHRGIEARDHRFGLAQIPLHRARQTRVVEIGQGRTGAPGNMTQIADDFRCQITDAGQWTAIDIGQQPDQQAVLTQRPFPDELTVRGGERNRGV